MCVPAIVLHHREFKDIIEIGVDVIHPVPVTLVVFPASTVVMRLAKHEEAIQVTLPPHHHLHTETPPPLHSRRQAAAPVTPHHHATATTTIQQPQGHVWIGFDNKGVFVWGGSSRKRGGCSTVHGSSKRGVTPPDSIPLRHAFLGVLHIKKLADERRRHVEFELRDQVMAKLLPQQFNSLRKVDKGLIQSFLKPYHRDEEDSKQRMSKRAPTTVVTSYDREVEEILSDRTIQRRGV
nr:hypothetical protein [Tanacetum cinerariifolium]